MADQISADVALVEVRQDNGRWVGYITPPWFRYLLASNPDGFGTGTGVLHGNPSGAPTWGPVDLTTDVTGVLPVANGGLGGITGIAGGLLYATGASSYSVTAAGTAHQVLHGGATPTWSSVNLSSDVAGLLPVVLGGTGVTTSTGTGSVVLSNAASMLALTVSNFLVNGIVIASCPVLYVPDATILAQGHISAANSGLVAINNAVTTALSGAAGPLFYVAHDQTSGGMSVGIVDPVVGFTSIVNTTAGIAFSMDAGTFQLLAKVTAGASPRNITTFIVSLG